MFLFLSIGIVVSQWIPSVSLTLSFIILASIFLLSIGFYFLYFHRLSIVCIYLLLVSYGLLLSDYSIVPDLASFEPKLLSFLPNRLSVENETLLYAITLGRRAALTPEIVSDFRIAGVAHVLVVSGMHVGFIYLLISFFIRRMPYKLFVAILGLFILWGYAFVVGFTVSVCRAVFMFSVLLVLQVVGERYRSFHALFLPAFIQLLLTPSALFDVSFQLSYTAVFSILLFYPLFPSIPTHVDSTESKRTLQLRKIANWIYKPIRLTLSAQILIAPLVAYYFGQFPLYFVLTNLAITLLIPVIFIGGFMLFIPYISNIIAYPLEFLLDLLRYIVSYVASMPMALVQVRISLVVLILIYLLIALVVCYALYDSER